MSAITELLSVALAYAAAEGVDLSTVSWRALGDTKKLAALQKGADIQVGRHERTMRWFSENWPDGAEWPRQIRRPAPAEAAE